MVNVKPPVSRQKNAVFCGGVCGNFEVIHLLTVIMAPMTFYPFPHFYQQALVIL